METLNNIFKNFADGTAVRKDIIRYVLLSHIGHIFKGGSLDPSQIDVQFRNGVAIFNKLELDVEFLNQLGDHFNFPLRVVRGHIDESHFNAPWINFWNEGFSISATFKGLHLTLEPKEDIDDAASMWSSAIGRLVEKSKFKNNGENPVLLNEGAKKVNEFMIFVLSRLSIEFENTVICLQPRNSELGIRLAIELQSTRFYDETQPSEKVPEKEFEKKKKTIGSSSHSAFTKKIIEIQGVTFWITDVPNEFGNNRNEHKRINKENKSDIMFAVINQAQKITLLIKQSDNQDGPGVWVHTELGDFIIFLTPREIYLLSEFMEEYCKGGDYRFGTKTKRVQKPMTDSDFQKLETILQQQTCHPNTQYTGLPVGYGWSGMAIDETEEQYYSMSGNQSECAMSMMESMESAHFNASFHGSEYSERPTTISNVYGPNATNYGAAMSCVSGGTQRPSNDPGREFFSIDLNITSLAVVILHGDILQLVQSDGITYTQNSISKLQELSTNFLTSILQINLIPLLSTSAEEVNRAFDDACNVNNIRLISTSVNFHYEMDPPKKKCNITFKTSNLNLLECLFEKGKESEKVPLLKSVDPSQESLYISMVKQKNNSHSNLVITISKCEVELDITIIDRLSALFNLPIFCQSNNSSRMQPRHTTHFSINIPSADFKLRFPIPDFTPLYDPSRVPWWKRNVRSDYMTLKCSQFKFETDFSTHKKSQIDEYSIKFVVLNLFYNESAKAKPIFFAQIGDDDHKYEDCRFSIKILPTTKIFNIELEDDAATQTAFCENLIAKRDNGPFTSKKVVHHSTVDHMDDGYPELELLIPGDCKEIEEFKMSSKRSAKILLSLVLSSVKIQIISKHTYEMIYNRINNDLLTWEPCAPKNKFNAKNDIFGECNSGAHYVDSDDDCDEYYDKDDLMFHSIFEGPKPEETESSSTFIKKYVDQSKLVIDVKIINGTIVFNPPVRDASSNYVIPGQLGYFSIDVSEAYVFLVTGYKGDRELDYLCIDVRSCDMRHREMMPSFEVKNCLPDLRRIPSNLYPVISKSVGALAEERKGLSERQMLTVACKILTRHDTHHVKTVKIALGLNKSTLHHRMTAEPNSWVSQLIDFFKVTDFPINGYKSKDVMSEFHLHTWDCAIDYRPLYLPLRCALTLGSFSMNSCVSEVSKGSKLRFLAEDCDLYISKENTPKDGIASNIPINIRREYINIMTMNMFELSLLLNEKNHKTKPRLNLRVTTDHLYIHTCSDSLKALTELIGYIAADGDLMSNASSESNSPYPSPRHGPGDQELITVDPQALEICEISEKQRQEINSLIGEAICEEKEEKKEKKPKKEPKSREHPKGFYSQIKDELGDIGSSDEDFEDSFCIIDQDNNWGLNFNHATPDIEWFITESVKLTDQYFSSPTSKKDLLKTPTNFPLPINIYTLCELNIIWKLYGGRDFQKPEDKKRERRERYSSNEDNCSTVTTTEYTESICSRSTAASTRTFQETIPEKDWKLSGGFNRNKDILMEISLMKVRCQFDVYPETEYHAHRFVFQIKEFEIIDKMKCSEINKFLCQYTSESNPKQSQAYMFVVEAVNIRPPEMMGETECSLRFSLLPLRFYIDQESLEFLMQFFSELSQKSNDEKTTAKASSKNSTPIHQKPKLTVKKKGKKKHKSQNDEDENLIDLDNLSIEERSQTSEREYLSDNSSNRPLFFRPVSFGPESFVKIDYKGKHVGVADGSVSGMAMGLVMGLAEINNSEIRLRRVCHRHGILGLDKVINYIIEEWMNDIKKNQLQNVLISVGPMHSVLLLLSGFRDLIWIPIEQYQKDGRIVKGLRKGANKFTTSTALAALELTFKFFHLLQVTAETAYDILSPGPSVRQITNAKKKKKNYSQPQDIREGVSNALWLVKEGFGDTAQTFVQVATKECEQKGVVGVVGGIARQIPPNLIKPIIIGAEATNNVLGGIRSQLVPDAKLEANQKWRNNFD